jgi:DNA-binding CsgD family transcriptional regulator
VDVMTLLRAVGALDDAATTGTHPVCDMQFVDALTRLIPCEGVSLLELDPESKDSRQLEALAWPGDDQGDGFWDHFWDSLPCCYTELGSPRDTAPRSTTDFYSTRAWHSSAMYTEVMKPAGIEWDLVVPLPSPPRLSRRLVFFRGSGRPFDDDDTAAARVLRPHVVEATRMFERREAQAPLTPRQRELLGLCAAGFDNTRIARSLDMATGTVRKHLENAFVRLRVQSRAQAVALTHPDLVWT